MLSKIKYKLFGKFQNKKRLEQMKKNPFKRVDSEKMTDIEKMDKGFNGKTYSINGMDVEDLLEDVKINLWLERFWMFLENKNLML